MTQTNEIPTVRFESEAPEGQEVLVVKGDRTYRYFWNSLGSRRTFPNHEGRYD